jgi:hypothetical protein
MTIPLAHGPFRAHENCLRWQDGRLAVWLTRTDGRTSAGQCERRSCRM